jgi:alpha-amylase
MKQICLIFHNHQPVRLRDYRFYEIGGTNSYFNEEQNKNWLTKTANKKFIPVNKILLDIFNNPHLQFKVSFSFSGSTLDLFETFTPNLIKNLKMMNQIGNVEFLGETYSNVFTKETSHDDLIIQIENQKKKIFNLFGQIPHSFRNNGSYCNFFLAPILTELGYKVLLNNTAEVFVSLPHPNTIFQFPGRSDMKLLFGNKELSEAIAEPKDNNFKKPMTADLLLKWINKLPEEENIVTLFIDYSAFIKDQSSDTTLMDFLRELPAKAKESNIEFITPAEIIKKTNFKAMPISTNSIQSQEKTYKIDAADKLLQKEIFDLLFSLKSKVFKTKNDRLIKTWYYLQDYSHFGILDQKIQSTDFKQDGFQETIGTYFTLRNILQDLSSKVNLLLEEKNCDFGQTFRLSDPNKWSFQNDTISNKEQKYLIF